MHLLKRPRPATLAGARLWYSCGCLLLVLLVEATNAANTENKQHNNEQPTQLANLTLRANNTSARPPAPQRQINSANIRHRDAKASSSSPMPLQLPPLPLPPPPPSPSPAYNNNQSQRLISKYKLPSWFHFNTFKQLYGKRYHGGYADELHKRIYLRTSLKVFEQRALYRSGRLDSLASVNELSDLTGEQLDQFRALRTKNSSSSPIKGARPPPPSRRQLPDCCTYDQVYARIIGLLSAATSANDSALSRALVDELEQKPLVESDAGGDEPIHDLERPLAAASSSLAPLKVAGNERPTPLVKSTRRANKAAPSSNIDDKRGEHKMIERRHRADGGQDDDDDDDDEKRVTKEDSSEGGRRKSGASSQQRRSGEQAKSNLVPDHHQTSTTTTTTTTTAAGRLRHARPGPNRSTTAASGKLAASNTQTLMPLTGRREPAHSGPADEEDERSAVEVGVPKEIEEAVRAQVAEQLSSSSALGRELSKQMSAYFGRPVEIRAVPATSPQHTSSPQKPRPKQQQQQPHYQQQQSSKLGR